MLQKPPFFFGSLKSSDESAWGPFAPAFGLGPGPLATETPTPLSILPYTSLVMRMKASSTLMSLKAEVSMKGILNSFAKASPSSKDTACNTETQTQQVKIIYLI